MMKNILLLPFLALLSCTNVQDETALFQDAYLAVFDSLLIKYHYKDYSVYRTLTQGLDEDVIRQDLNDQEFKRVLEKSKFDIEASIRLWEKYNGKDLSIYLAEKHLHFLVSKDNTIDRGTNISFSAPIFNSDTSIFFFYMVYETNEENKESRSHKYYLFGKTKDSWHWIVQSSMFEDN